MKAIAKIGMLLLGFLLSTTFVFAQEQPEMADTMRSNGKIYVVVAVLLVILIGLFIYLIALDRKIKKLEQQD